ncbi:Uncharacterised protein [Mycobacteroides abscessus subsp. massiliense]|nr:Uncharacterised protein [Mycobacteroides abscessus subsp. massiliense]SKE06041.1 Uncharacterised protein [Mycobacteroides abscessus subsp. massiliense]SKE07685.1 Uncharacterised protein [Mycobacteroides abscessus subsp. massiliense]SKE59718.1 Uncharacterised protein [Mycobacteroides abscessus subsp. massiliense]SKE60903.1 Uncharacterised protein [Mycobacteroides abscessus subsp. massiliense]
MLAWAQENNPWDPESFVDGLIAAANSIPEGAPVGTIARRPDGMFLAVRKAESSGAMYWQYWAPGGARIADGMPLPSDADSWPVIFAPNEVGSSEHTVSDGDAYDPTGKTLDELHAEIDRLDKAEDSALRERDYWEETVNRILYTCSSEDEIGEWSSANDPVERFIEQFKPVKRIDPTAQQEPGVSDPRSTSSYGLSRNEPVAPKPPRTPRVRDRLGVDEQGARWLDSDGGQVLFNTDQWMRLRPDGTVGWFGVDYEPTETAPYVELIEPRVLPSLDCEEARDGTVWEARYVLLVGREQTPGWKFQHTQDGWVYEDGSRVLSPEFLTGRGPYTEVLGDPS